MRRTASRIAAGLCGGLVVAALLPAVAWGQDPSSCPSPTDAQSVYVLGVDGGAVSLGAPELEALPRAHAEVVRDDGGADVYEGVTLAALLARVDVPMESLRGPQAATVVVAEARDGYRAAYALAELDASFSDRLVLLADRKNGEALGDAEGPFRIVMRGERRHSRWIRQVSCLRVVRP